MEIPFQTGLELSDIVTVQEIKMEDGIIRMTGDYFPILEHSQRFCELTGDTNPIHQENPRYREAISPTLLQTTVVMRLIKEAMKSEVMKSMDLNPTACEFLTFDQKARFDIDSFPFSYTSSKTRPIITGYNYSFEVEADPTELTKGIVPVKASAKLEDNKGNVVYNLKIEFDDSTPPLNLPINKLHLVHSKYFKGGKVSEFGELIGSKSLERRLFVLASASSVVCSALDDQVIHMDEDVMALYTSQQIHADSSTDINPKKGVSLHLYLPKPEEFGKLSEKGKFMNMIIIARNHKGRFLYMLQAPLAFKKSKRINTLFKLAQR